MRSRLAGSRKQGSGPLWLRYYGLLLVAAVLAQAEQATDSQMHLIHSRSKAALRASGQLRQLRQLSNRPPAPSSTPTTPSNTPTTPITGPDGSLIEDKRVRVEDTTEFPFSTIGLLRVVGMDGSEWWCTAALVADKFALTAAHCLQYPPARRADFTPGYDPHSNHSEPYGTALVTDTWVLPAYLSCNEDPDCEHVSAQYLLCRSSLPELQPTDQPPSWRFWPLILALLRFGICKGAAQHAVYQYHHKHGPRNTFKPPSNISVIYEGTKLTHYIKPV